MKNLFLLVLLSSPMSVLGSTLLVLNFDDCPGGLVANGYQGFQWDKFAILNGFTAFPAEYGTGYRYGVVSGNNVAFNDDEQPATIRSASTFDLDSAYLTAAWNDGLHVQVKGFSGGTLLYDNTYIINPVTSTLVHFNYLGIDTVVFSSFGGGNHGFIGTGNHFVMDNLIVTVPEPATPVLLLVGAFILLFTRCRTSHTRSSKRRPSRCGCNPRLPQARSLRSLGGSLAPKTLRWLSCGKSD